MFAAFFRKLNHLAGDPVLRRWLLGRIIGRWPAQSMAWSLPPYLDGISFNLDSTTIFESHAFASACSMCIEPDAAALSVAIRWVFAGVLLTIGYRSALHVSQIAAQL